jgi:hypothetical protein
VLENEDGERMRAFFELSQRLVEYPGRGGEVAAQNVGCRHDEPRTSDPLRGTALDPALQGIAAGGEGRGRLSPLQPEDRFEERDFGAGSGEPVAGVTERLIRGVEIPGQSQGVTTVGLGERLELPAPPCARARPIQASGDQTGQLRELYRCARIGSLDRSTSLESTFGELDGAEPRIGGEQPGSIVEWVSEDFLQKPGDRSSTAGSDTTGADVGLEIRPRDDRLAGVSGGDVEIVGEGVVQERASAGSLEHLSRRVPVIHEGLLSSRIQANTDLRQPGNMVPER